MNKQTSILLIDNDAAVTDLLSVRLREARFQVITARDGASGLLQARDREPSLIVLDLDLPKVSGFDVGRQLQSDLATRHIPFIILSVRDSENDRIAGFELGADDYVTKPFSAREVLLRIRKSLDRASHRPETLKEKISLRTFTLDPGLHEFAIRNEPVHLTRIEFRLLAKLMENHGRTFSRGNLMEIVWGQRSDTNTRTIDSHVRRLRAKLGPAGNAIETILGYGYRLNEKGISAFEESVKRQSEALNMELPIPKLEHGRAKTPGSRKSRAGLLALK